jgi:hypothetical protein
MKKIKYKANPQPHRQRFKDSSFDLSWIHDLRAEMREDFREAEALFGSTSIRFESLHMRLDQSIPKSKDTFMRLSAL